MSIASAVAEKRVLQEQSLLCKLGRILAFEDREDREALEYAINMVRADQAKEVNKRYFTIAWLTKVLNDNGYPIGKTAVSDHVGEVCACEHPSE